MIWSDWRGEVAARTVSALRLIVVSRPYVVWNDEAAILEVLLHEVAHALDPTRTTVETHHNERWRAIYVAIGGTGLESVQLKRPGWERPGERSRLEAAGLVRATSQPQP